MTRLQGNKKCAGAIHVLCFLDIGIIMPVMRRKTAGSRPARVYGGQNEHPLGRACPQGTTAPDAELFVHFHSSVIKGE